MHWQHYLRVAQIALVVLMLIGTAAWVLLGPPDEPTTRNIVQTIDRISQSRAHADELSAALKASDKLKANATSAEIEAWRLHVTLLLAGIDKRQADLKECKADWLPVADTDELLATTRESARLGLAQIPRRAVDPRDRAKAGALEVDPDKAGVNDAAVILLTARGNDLNEAANRLGSRVEQAVHRLTFTSTTWMGLQPATFLWLLVVLVVCFSLAIFQGVLWRLQVSPLDSLKAQLDMHGRVDPHEAFRYTHQLVQELLRHSEEYQTASARSEES